MKERHTREEWEECKIRRTCLLLWAVNRVRVFWSSQRFRISSVPSSSPTCAEGQAAAAKVKQSKYLTAKRQLDQHLLPADERFIDHARRLAIARASQDAARQQLSPCWGEGHAGGETHLCGSYGCLPLLFLFFFFPPVRATVCRLLAMTGVDNCCLRHAGGTGTRPLGSMGLQWLDWLSDFWNNVNATLNRGQNVVT